MLCSSNLDLTNHIYIQHKEVAILRWTAFSTITIHLYRVSQKDVYTLKIIVNVVFYYNFIVLNV